MSRLMRNTFVSPERHLRKISNSNASIKSSHHIPAIILEHPCHCSATLEDGTQIVLLGHGRYSKVSGVPSHFRNLRWLDCLHGFLETPVILIAVFFQSWNKEAIVHLQFISQ